jgi:hypothetical protein
MAARRIEVGLLRPDHPRVPPCSRPSRTSRYAAGAEVAPALAPARPSPGAADPPGRELAPPLTVGVARQRAGGAHRRIGPPRRPARPCTAVRRPSSALSPPLPGSELYREPARAG